MATVHDEVTDKRRAEIERKVRRQVSFEKRAFECVKHFSLADSVTEEELVRAGQEISQENYWDITEERSIGKVCGYPLCSNPLHNIPKQKYKISLQNSRVYDITERKKFCSDTCYKSSKHFHQQISTSPVWLRKTEAPVQFTLLARDKTEGESGEAVFQCPWTAVAEVLQEIGELSISDKTEQKKKKQEPSETAANAKISKAKESKNVISENCSEKAASSCSHPSMTTDDAKNKHQVEISMLPRNEPAVAAMPSTSKMPAAVTSPTEAATPVASVGPRAAIEPTASGAAAASNTTPRLSLYERIRIIKEWRTLKTVDFFHPTARLEILEYATKVEQFYGASKEEEEDAHFRLVPVDRYAPNLLRRKIVHDKLFCVWPKLQSLLNCDVGRCMNHTKELIKTFAFSSQNIVFQTPEWLVIGYIILRMLERKQEDLFGEKRMKKNLVVFAITEEEISEIVDYMISFGDMEMVD